MDELQTKAKRNLLLYGLLAILLGLRIVKPEHEGSLSVEGFGVQTHLAWVYVGLMVLIAFNWFAYWYYGGHAHNPAHARIGYLLHPSAGAGASPAQVYEHVSAAIKFFRLPQDPGDVAIRWAWLEKGKPEDLFWFGESGARTREILWDSLSVCNKIRLHRIVLKSTPAHTDLLFGFIWKKWLPLGVAAFGAFLALIQLAWTMCRSTATPPWGL